MSQTTDLTDDSTEAADEPPTADRVDARGSSAGSRGLGIWAWSFVGLRRRRPSSCVIALGGGQRDRAPDDVRGRAGRDLQAAGRHARTPQDQAHPWPPASSSSVCSP